MTQQLLGQVVLSSILEGVDTTGTVATFSDANTSDVAADFTATVNWGDGTTEVGTVTGQNGSFAVAVPGSTHFYSDKGTDTITVTVTGPTAGNIAPTNLHYFLAIDGLDGGSTDAAHVGWFDVSSYDVGALVAALAGKATFSPLTVTLPSTGLTGVLADLAKGTTIKSVRLEGVTGGANPAAVYDLTLGNVTVSNYDDAASGDKLSLSYQQVELTTTAINPDGSLSPQTFSWDLATNAAGGSIPAPTPSTAAGNIAPTNLHYFLAIDGLDGGSTDAAHVGWFDVSSYDVGALVAALAGKATFSPLTVTLPSTGLTGVLADLAKGTTIKSVRLEGVTGGANPAAVYDLTLGNVTVSNYDDAASGDKLSLSYQQVELTTTAINPDGSLSPQTFSWDLATNAAGGSIPAPTPSTVAGNIAPTNLHYFLAIDGLDGGSTDAAHAGWFDVSSYDVGALVAALAGKATFSPLTVTLPSTGLTGVLADLAKGTTIKSVRLEGVTGGANPAAVYDLTLGNVTVSNYDDAASGDKLSLSYQQVELTTTAINPDGSLSPQTFSWDLATNAAGGSIPAPTPSTVAGNIAPTNLHYFLAIDGLDGGSTDAAHVGWFDVSSYDVGALVAALAGKATFSPLTVTLPSTGLTGVLADLAKGTTIKSVRLEGVTGGANPAAVYDLTLGNVTVSNYDDAASGDKLSLSYQQVELTTTAINPDGSLSPQTFSWDLATNAAGGSIPAPTPSTAAGNIAPTNLHYFLAIDGLDGGSTDAAHAGWFDVSSYDVGALVAALAGKATFSPLTVTLPSTGLTGVLADLAKGTTIKSVRLEGVTGGANPAAVYDLTLGNVTVSNYDDAASGDKLSLSYQQVELTTTAINPDGSLSPQTFSWDLATNAAGGSIPAPTPSTVAGNIAPTNLHYFLAIDGLDGGSTDAAHVGWFDVSSYDVGALVAALAGKATFSPLTVTLPSTGLTGVLADLAKGTTIKSVRLEGVTGGANPAAVYDLTLGNVTVSNYDDAASGDKLSLSYQQVELTTTAINPDGSLSPQTFSWDLATNAAGGSIPAPTPSTASDQITLTGTVLVEQLSGQVVLSSILEGVDTTGTVATFRDANTHDVAGDFTATVNWGDGTTEVGTVTGQNGSFAVAVPGSTHFYSDKGTDTITVTVTGAAAGNIAPTNLHYFLAIDGLDGGSTDAAHVGWFDVSSYDVGALVAALAGKATFSPLTVTLPSTGLTGVLADLAKGTTIKSVRLEGVTGGANPAAVYDLTLGNVTVSNYDDAASGDKLSLSYQQVELTTTAINPDGSLSPQTFSWDLATNAAGGSIPAPTPSTVAGNIAPTNLHYFLAIDGLDGGSTDAAHAGWFDVSSYDVGALVAALAGKATFSPLTVTLPSTGLTGVLADLAKGTTIKSVRLEGVTGGANPAAVYDLTLGNVTVSNYDDAASGDKLSLSYQQVELTTTAINPDGSLSPQTFSWDLATNAAGGSIPAPTPSTVAGNIAPTNLHYFLAIDGLDGGSTDAAHVGWFDVSSYDVGALVAALAGKATFSPLTVTLPSTGLTGVLADLAKGTTIKSVRLEGVTGGANPAAVYDLTLGNVTVSNYDDAASGDKLSLSYQQVELTTTAINPDGSLSPQTFSWDLATNAAGGSIPAPTPSTAAGNIAPTNLHYFLAIDGLDGGSTDAAHVGWFDVSSYDVGALVAALAGKATFSPLTVTLPSTGLTGVLADLAKGTTIKSVRLEGVTGGANPAAVYDLTLGNVTVSNYDDAASGDKLSLSYQQVELTTTAINPDGSLSPQTFSWDLATNAAGGSIPAPTPSTVAGNIAPTNLHYFLAIDGLDGGSTDAAHAGWFDVSSYDVGALVAALAGKATFSPLTVTLPSTGLTGVLADLAKGTTIKSVRLEGVTGGANPAAVYDLTLGNVTVSNYDDAASGDKLSLSYQQVELTTTAINPDGSLSPQTFSWDLATNAAGGSIPAPTPSTVAGNIAPTNLHYFLAIDGLDGGSTDAAHVGWFDVSSYDVGALVAALAGKATFSPLTVTLPSTGLTGVLADLAKGTTIKSVRLEGVTGGANPAAVYDLTLGNVTVSNYDDAASGDKLSLSYQQVELTTTAINPDGSLSPQTFSWDLATNAAGGSIPAPTPSTASDQITLTGTVLVEQLSGQVVLSSILEGVDTTGTVATFRDANTHDVAGDFTATVNWGDGTTEVGTVTGQNGSFAVAVPGSTHFYSDKGTDTITVTVTGAAAGNIAPTNLHYFLAIDGLDGGSTDAAHAGWFDVSSYDVGALVAALAGKATFSPLTVTLPSTGLTGVLADLAKGTTIKSVRLEGVTGGANPAAVYDLTLGNVTVSNYDDAASGDKLSLSYQQVELTTTAINPDGSLSPQTFSWDLATNAAGGSIPAPTPSTVAGNIAPTNLHYFLAIDGLDGGSTDAAHAGWFDVSSYDVGALVAALAGKATFSPLTVTLPSTGLTGVLADLAKGTTIKSVRLEGVTGGANPAAVYDLTLGNVTVSNYDDAASGDKLSLSYQQVELTTTAINPDGSLSPQTFSWDLATNAAGGSIPAPTPSTVAGNIAPTNLHYFLAIDGLDGGSTDAAHVGWFDVSSYDVGALVAALAGKATFSPLTVTLPSTGLTGVLADLAKGTTIKSVRLEGVTGGANPAAVYDLTLGNVTVSNYDDAASGDKLSLSYQQVELTTTAINPDGSLSPQTFSWDLATNAAGGSIPAPTPSTVAGNIAPTNLHYFLAIDGLDGGSTDAAHVGWFDVSSYDVGALVAALAGKATFSPLTVTLPSTGLTGVLADLAKGTTIKSVRLEGVTGGANPAAVYDLTLGNVTVSNYDDAASGDKLSLSYQQVELTTTAINPDGSLSPQTFSWDLATNAAGGSIPAPTPSTAAGNIAPTNLHYFLAIDGLDGGSTDAAHVGWFNVSSYDVGALVAALAGKATFSPLTVTLPSTGLTGVLADLAKGTTIKSVRLEGVTGGANPAAVYDLTLGNVTVSNYDDAASGDKLSLSYQQVELTTTAINPDGSLSPQTFSWDLATNAAGGSIPAPTPSTAAGNIAPTNLRYFLAIDGLDGGSTDAAHVGWFDVSSYDVGALVAALAGKATFSPLTVTLPSTGLTGVLADLAKGTTIKSVRLEGVTGGANPAAVYDLTLGNVTVSNYDDAASGDKLSLSYQQVELTTTAINPDGSLSPQTFSWDLATNAAGGSIPAPTPSTASDQITLTGTVLVAPAGPSITSVTPSVVEKGQTTEIGTVTPGLAGDTLTLQQTGGRGALALQLVNGVEEVIYTAPSVIAASALDTVSYTISDQHNDAMATGSASVQLDAGPSITSVTPSVVEKGQTTEVGTVTPGLAGDTLTLKQTGGGGALALKLVGSVEEVIYTASVTVAASTLDAVSYTVTDQLGGTTTGSASVQLDAGPTIASVTPAVVEKGQSTEIGTVAAGLAGDMLTLKQTGGGGALALKLVGSVEEVIYTAPVTVAASTLDAVSYTVTDQLGGTTTGSASVQLDAGPTIASVTPAVVEKGQSTEIGTVAAGLAGDMLTLKQTGGGGALALKLVGSVEEVIYTAPVTVAASTLDAVSYTVTDQLGGTTTGSASVQLDAGPTIASVTPAVVEKGQSTEIGTVAAGLAGDMLTLKQTGGGGALALKLVGSVEEVIYTAPVTVAASTLDAVSYTVTDQLGGTATGSSTIPVASGTSSIIVGTAGHAVSAGNNNSVIDGRAGNETIQAGNGTDVVFAGPNDTIQAGNGNDVVLGGSSDKISLGNGNDTVNAGAGSSVSAGNGNDTITAGGNVTLGNGNDTVTSTGANSKITLGNGVDVVYAAANDTISLGNGNDTVYAGANDTISLGKGADTVAFGVGSSPAAFGNETVNSFSVHSDQIDLSLAQFVSYAAMMSNHEITSSGANTIITDGHGDNVTLTGVAPSSLSASNFRFS